MLNEHCVRSQLLQLLEQPETNHVISMNVRLDHCNKITETARKRDSNVRQLFSISLSLYRNC